MKILLIILLFIIGCQKDGIKKSQTDNPDIRVDFLFEHEGCRLYRFYDDHAVYYSNCGQTMQMRNCGKSCKRQESVTNEQMF